MEENQNGLWFALGYLTAIAVEIFAARLINLVNDLLSETVAVSPNGAAATARDEEIAHESVQLIHEYTEDKPSE